MKILYHHRIRSKDGQYVHIEELTTALRAAGHELVIVGPRHVSTAGFGADAGVVAHLKKLLPRAVYEILELLYAIPAFMRILLAAWRFNPDFIYERYNLLYPAGALAKRVLGLPLLLEINAPLFEERNRFGGIALQRLALWSERFVWCSANCALPVTAALAEHVIAAGVAADRVTVVPNGINAENFCVTETSEHAKARLGLAGCCVLGFVGFVRSWHGLDRVLKFLASECNQSLRLLLVGDGPARTELEQAARELGITEKLVVTGIVPRDEVASYINAFDVALQPAVVGYASPLKLFEYLAMGKAIVAPATPNICEVLEHGRNGLLFDMRQDGSFEAALRQLVEDTSLRVLLGAAAAATIVEQGLTWSENAARVTRLAQQAIVRSSQP